MTDDLRELTRDQTGDIEDISIKLGRLTLEPKTGPSLVVSEPATGVELNLRSNRRMAFRVGRGRHAENVELREDIEEL